MTQMVAGALATGCVIAWAVTYPWIHRATDGRTVLMRFACTLVLPMLGTGAAAVMLRGARSWPMLVLVVAGGLCTGLAALRLRFREP